MNAELHATLSAMLDELQSSRLVVVVCEAPEPAHEGHGVRVAVEKNAAWYRQFCASFPSSRRDQNRHGRTAIKRRDTEAALRAMLAGGTGGPCYGPRLMDAARRYWRRNRAEIAERIGYAAA